MTSRRLAAVHLVVAVAVAAGCGPSPTPTPAALSPTATTIPSPATPSPSAPPSPSPAATVPAGRVFVDISAAGIRLPVPADWELVDEAALADESVQADVVARYPGMGALLEAATELGDRARPALLALDPAAEASDVALTPTVAVLVAQPAVRGPLLDLVAGFIADGLTETFKSGEPTRERVDTPIGEAIRLAFELPADGDVAMAATAWVVGADEATLLITVVGPSYTAPASEADALITAAEPLPTP